MPSKTFTDKNGQERTVVAGSQEELDSAVKDVKNLEMPASPDINVPVRKGHDLVDVADDFSVNLVDGTGAHNSPRDAVRDDGSVEGDSDVPVVVSEPDVADAGKQKKLVKDGKVADL